MIPFLLVCAYQCGAYVTANVSTHQGNSSARLDGWDVARGLCPKCRPQTPPALADQSRWTK